MNTQTRLYVFLSCNYKTKVLFAKGGITLVLALTLLTGCFNDKRKGIIKSDLEGIHAAFFNSKGSEIAATTTNGYLLLLDSSLNLKKAVSTRQGNSNSSFFSLDDRFIITGGRDKRLCVWNSNSLELEREYFFAFNSYTSVHGTKTLGGCGESGVFLIYNIETRDTYSISLEKSGAYHLYYCYNDSVLVVSSGRYGYQIDIVNKIVLNKYISHKDEVFCIMPSNDRQWIVTCSADSTAKVFERISGKLLFTSSKLDGKGYVCTFNKDDSQIAVSTNSGSIFLFDNQLKNLIHKIEAFPSIVNTIHYSPDGKKLVAASEGGGIKIFSTDSWIVINEYQ